MFDVPSAGDFSSSTTRNRSRLRGSGLHRRHAVHSRLGQKVYRHGRSERSIGGALALAHVAPRRGSRLRSHCHRPVGPQEDPGGQHGGEHQLSQKAQRISKHGEWPERDERRAERAVAAHRDGAEEQQQPSEEDERGEHEDV